MRLPDFEAWAIFAKVAEHGSFARAADELHLSRPTISKAVGRLEMSLGVSLFSRNSRQLSVTETGRLLLGRAQRILLEAELAEGEARGGKVKPSGLIRLTAPMTFGVRHLSPILPAFLEQYPEIDLAVNFSDSLVDLVAEGYDLALRISSLGDSSLRARRLCTVPLHLVAAPVYWERIGRPQHPRDLKDHKSFVYMNGAATGMLRFQKHGTNEEYLLSQSSRFQADNAEAFLPALNAGLGFGVFPQFMVDDGLKSGRLERVLPEWEMAEIGLYLVTPSSTLRPVRVTLLLDYLTQTFSQPHLDTAL